MALSLDDFKKADSKGNSSSSVSSNAKNHFNELKNKPSDSSPEGTKIVLTIKTNTGAFWPVTNYLTFRKYQGKWQHYSEGFFSDSIYKDYETVDDIYNMAHRIRDFISCKIEYMK